MPLAQTEVRLSEVPDRELHETTQPSERLETTLGAEGQFVLQWRAKVAVGQIDERLTVQSSALFDVQEDGLRLTWQLAMEFPGSQRDTFTLKIPADYLLENVSGDNVRGWRVQPANGGQQVDVTLLKAVGDRASFVLHLARYGAIGQDAATTIVTPAVNVSDAILHNGQIVVRRSPLLDVRTSQATGLARAAMEAEVLQALTSRVTVESPLGIRPFETYRFAAMPFQLVLSAQAYQPDVSAEIQSLFKISEREGSYEARVQLTVGDRPLYEVRLALPAGFRVDEVTYAGPHEWTTGEMEGRPTVTVYFADGRQGTIPLVIRGSLPVQPGVAPTPLPNLQVDRRLSPTRLHGRAGRSGLRCGRRGLAELRECSPAACLRVAERGSAPRGARRPLSSVARLRRNDPQLRTSASRQCLHHHQRAGHPARGPAVGVSGIHNSRRRNP